MARVWGDRHASAFDSRRRGRRLRLLVGIVTVAAGLVAVMGVGSAAAATAFLSGKVVDSGGKATAGATVVAFLDDMPADTNTAGITLDQVAQTTTSADGSYSISLSSPDAATQAQMSAQGGYANFVVYVMSGSSTSVFEIQRGRVGGSWTAWDGTPGGASDTSQAAQLDGAAATGVSPNVGCTVLVTPIGSPWDSWNNVSTLHTSITMTGHTTYSNATTTNMGFETTLDTGNWHAGGEMHIKHEDTVSNDTPYSTGTNSLLQGKMVYHRYNYNGCGKFYNRANVQDWTGGAQIGTSLSHLDCRTLPGTQRIPLTNGQSEHKNSGSTRSLGFHLSAAPSSSMLSVGMTEETSWSSSLDQYWKAQSSSQNYLCWGASALTLSDAKEVSASIQ